MFVRLEKSGQRGHVQIIENKHDGAAVRQRVIANLGRADELAPPARSPRSSPREPSSPTKCCSLQVLLINALDGNAEGALSIAANRIGGPMLFVRILERLGIVRSSTIC
jgi:hypothetical protein